MSTPNMSSATLFCAAAALALLAVRRRAEVKAGRTPWMRQVRRKMFNEALQQLPPEARLAAQARRGYRSWLDKTEHPNKCDRCWMMDTRGRSHCICDKLPAALELHHRIVLYIHHRELAGAKASNTAKLLLLGIKNVRMFVHGIPEHEEELARELAKARRG